MLNKICSIFQLEQWMLIMRKEFVLSTILIILAVVGLCYSIWPGAWKLMIFFGPILLLGCYDLFQKKHAIARNFPVLGRTRYLMEWARPKIFQYFIEPDTEGRPLNRLHRSVIYQRAKNQKDTTPFGTQMNLYDEGYEWMNHSIAAIDHHELDADPRVKIGGPNCKQPYSASLFNVAAMSFGSLSKRAILALNEGAKIGGFAHNTGEGGISPYHLEPGGDLIYQIGTGYFGCRNNEGGFDEKLFVERAKEPTVKMIELKLSQGAKPGHGGILPASKNTPEIAKIRSVEPRTAVNSPPYHKAFNTPKGLIDLIGKMQILSEGKPIGFKLCVGNKSEFIGICKAMIAMDSYPDFISVDGGEGGTGAAPLEFSDAVGMPFREGLAFVHDTLIGFGIRDKISLIASGKILDGFDIFRAKALGADACYSARAMMMAIGCIQALECHKNTCPTGVATQDEELIKGLVVSDKSQRVANYQKGTVNAFVDLLSGAGLKAHNDIQRYHVNRRISYEKVMRYDEIYPPVEEGCLRSESSVPESWKREWSRASAERF